ncbi:hypothetical protein [Acetobacter okinawensis]|nr:hypothetical protein [Acetobacter okinawensis]
MTTQHNMPLEDIQAALNAVLLRNGSVPVTSNWNMGSNRITFLADGAADTDAANVGQLKALLNNTALTGVTTVPAVTDWTAYQPVGAKDADARYGRLGYANTWVAAQTVNADQTVNGAFSTTGAVTFTNTLGSVTGAQATGTKKWNLSRSSTYTSLNSYSGSAWHPLIINDDDTAETAKGKLAFDADKVNRAGDTMTGTLSITGPSYGLTINSNANANASSGFNDASIFFNLTKRFGYAGVIGLREVVGASLNIVLSAFNGSSWYEFDLVAQGTNQGRLVSPAGVSAFTSDLPFSDTTLKMQAWTASGSGEGYVAFPTAFRSGTVPKVFLQLSREQNNTSRVAVLDIVSGTSTPNITNSGFTFQPLAFFDGAPTTSNQPYTMQCLAIGYF